MNTTTDRKLTPTEKKLIALGLEPLEYHDPLPGEEGPTATLGCPDCTNGFIQSYAHIDGGICYNCHGKGFFTYNVEKERKREKERIQEANRQWYRRVVALREEEERAVMNLESFQKENPTVWEHLQTFIDNDFGQSLLRQIQKKGELSEKQISAVHKVYDRKVQDAEDRANAEDVPEGRGVVEGVILSAKIHEGVYGDDYKMVLQDDRGFRVYGTTPSDLVDYFYWTWRNEYEEEHGEHTAIGVGSIVWLDSFKGKKVRLTATLTRSDDDPKFGFYKRPAKAEVL